MYDFFIPSSRLLLSQEERKFYYIPVETGVKKICRNYYIKKTTILLKFFIKINNF